MYKYVYTYTPYIHPYMHTSIRICIITYSNMCEYIVTRRDPAKIHAIIPLGRNASGRSSRVRRQSKPFSFPESKKAINRKRGRPMPDPSISKARKLLENSGFKITRIDLTQEEDEAMSADRPVTDRKGGIPQKSTPTRTISQCMRDGGHPDLVHDLEFGVRCSCGFLMLDSDVERSAGELNMIIRHQNVSVLILRSRSHWTRVKSDEKKWANMGAFVDTVGTWGKEPKDITTKNQNLKWEELKGRLEKRDEVTEEELPWDVDGYAKPLEFKAWWKRVVDASLKRDDTFWPMECSQSVAGTMLDRDAREEAVARFLETGTPVPSSFVETRDSVIY